MQENTLEQKKRPRITCFGEVLWDMLPSGKKIGGAPLNAAFHLNRLGVAATLVSRTGEDQNGAGIRYFLSANGVPFILETDPVHPTGTVGVKVGPDGGITYDIAREAAWDFIGFDGVPEDLTAHDCIIYGSLAARSPVSQRTLYALLERRWTKILDINLRPPFYHRDILERLLVKADILKMNEEEFLLVTAMFGCRGSEREKAERLQDLFGIHTVLVTYGAAGAACWDKEGMYREEGKAVQVVDTVGSGDAFLAGFVSASMRGCGPQDTLKAANAIGAFVAGKAGGCPSYDPAETGIF